MKYKLNCTSACISGIIFCLLLIRHGIRQLRNPWADGPEYVTQCPIQPGRSYTYQFTIQNQEGTLWWHAHSRWLRATVYGALIIYPKLGSPYPFPMPKREIPILLGNPMTSIFVRLQSDPFSIYGITQMNYNDDKQENGGIEIRWMF